MNFLEVLLRLVTDGIQPSRVCEHIRDIGLPTDRVAADAILHGLDEGRTVADAMVRVFQADIAAAMSAAEQSGGLAANGMAVLQRLQDQRDAKKGVYAQLSWPGALPAVRLRSLRRLCGSRLAGVRGGRAS